ncbi:MAG TPA: tRNA lysidine(34) synthetase TilS [Nocardioidaceae bacterium]|nr:tRNA lysidine(34) synthetase TilS [Nocardioidaceae bacterium]
MRTEDARRPRLTPVVADARRAVREALADLSPDSLALVALSGGADSLALLAAAVFEAPRASLRCGAIVVDHGLQADSESVAATAARQARGLGADPVEVRRVDVDGPGGPEAAAREARRTSLRTAADSHGAAAVLLGHTRDDQAETVLLGLARGSGSRSLSGMAARDGLWRRPLLGMRREQTEAVCRDVGLEWWSDPHNADAALTRVRVRTRVLPTLETELGPGIVDALARTADLARADADLLDAQAADLHAAVADADGGLDAGVLASAPDALRSRVLRKAAIGAGSPGTDLTAGHVDALDRLVTDWHGQRGVDLPGGVVARRIEGRVRLARSGVAG